MRTGSSTQGQEQLQVGTMEEGMGLGLVPALTLTSPVGSGKPPPTPSVWSHPGL